MAQNDPAMLCQEAEVMECLTLTAEYAPPTPQRIVTSDLMAVEEERHGETTTTAVSRPVVVTNNKVRTLLHDLSSEKARELLLVADNALTHRFDLTSEEVCSLLEAIAATHSPLMSRSGVTSLQRTAEDVLIRTGLAELDDVLLGGLREGFVVNLTGPSGIGKTRMAMQWALHAAASEQGRRVMWMHTCPIASFDQLVLGALPPDGKHIRSWQHLFLSAPLTTLDHTISEVQWMCNSGNMNEPPSSAGLLVLDNFTQLVHRSYSGASDSLMQRQQKMGEVLQALKELAVEKRLCVLIVTTSAPVTMGEGHRHGSTATASSEGPGEFGSSLYHAVNLQLKLSGGMVHSASRGIGWGRHIAIQKSSLSGPCSIELGFSHPPADATPGSLIHAYAMVSEEAPAAVDAWDFLHVPNFLYL